MTCDCSRTTVHAYIDGELDAVRAAEFERHIEECGECRMILEQVESLRSRLRESDLYERAPVALEQRIRKQLSLPGAAKPEAAISWRRWLLAPAFALAAVVAVFWLALLLVQPHTRSAQVTAELIDAHVRSLQPGHLTDVISTDQHTVKPWFDGKLDFSPPVTDFSDQGFPLIGGRLDYIGRRNVAALVYQRRKHLINVFVWPESSGGSSSNLETQRFLNGYNFLGWWHGGVYFCAVSDVSVGDLRQLKELLDQ